MKRLYSIILFLLISVVANAQPYETNPDFNRTRNWHFGHGVGLRFDPDTIYEVPTSIHTDEAAAVHTDVDGNLLLYSNGEKIWNANHQVIHNGNLALGHHSSSMGSVFVFHEDNPNYIYLFNTNYSLSNKEFSFNLLVKETDSFRIVFKDSVLQTNISEPIAVVKADNGKDIWIVTHVFNGSQFITFKLTKEGLVYCPIVSNSFSFAGSGFQGAQFDIVFSLDGKYLLKSNQSPIINRKDVTIYSFNSKKGTIQKLFSFEGMHYPITGIGFSEDNSNLFIVERDGFLNIFSFDPQDSSSTINSKKQIPIEGYKFEMQNLTYSNDIALLVNDSSHLALIVDPNDYFNVDLNLQGVILGSGKAFNGLPNFNRSYFHTPPINFTFKLDCVLNTIQFKGQDTFNAINHSWHITKQGAMPITADIKTPLIEFEDTGVYTVRYIASNGSRSDTMIKTIEILPKIEKNFLGNDTGWCNVTSAPIELYAPNGMHCYEWNTGEMPPQITADTTGVYIVKITTPNFCVLFDTINISVDTVETIESNFLGEDKFWCKNLDTSVSLKAIDGFESYNWNNGSNNQQLITSEEGIYYVEAFKRNQCASGGNIYVYDTIVITLLNAPDKPTLNRLDDSLFTNLSIGISYNWFKNNELLTDTLNYIILKDTGNYFLKVTNSNNCINNSDTIHVATLGIVNTISNSIKLYPNPATTGVFNTEVLNGEYSYTITDITGKAIMEGFFIIGANITDISHIADGIYFITINNNQNSITYKIIKQTE